MRIDAFHLPGLEEAGVAAWDERGLGGDVVLRVPVLEPDTLRRVLARLNAARAEHLASRPVTGIVRALGEAAARFADPDAAERRLAERLLPELTGYSPVMVRLVLDRMSADWAPAALERLLRAELGDPALLDDFAARAGAAGRRRAYGPALAFHIFAGNVPGVAVTSLVRSLLVKAATLGKTAAGEPLLPALFARALAEVDPALGACLAVTYWPGGSEPLEAVAMAAADTVVLYGGEDAEADVRRRAPARTRLVVHGPRVSFGVIAREMLRRDVARRTAAQAGRAVALFDQQGCVSPHLFYVERGGEQSPEEFAALLDAELGLIEDELPRGRLSAEEAAAIQRERGHAEFAEIGGRSVRLLAGPKHTVIYEEDPEFAASCLNRVVRVKPVADLRDVPALVRPLAHHLQTVGIASDGDRRRDLAARLGELGASRITDLPGMPWPPPDASHDGRGPLRELLRWVDLEA